MRLLIILSNLIVPVIIVFIISYGLSKKIDLFSAFAEGAKEGFTTVLSILPTLIGLMTAVGVLRAGGVMEILEKIVCPLTEKIGMPAEIIPLGLLRLVSSSASTGILLDIFKNYGTDTFTGRFVSVMMYCTESIVYVMSVYFLAAGIKKTRYTFWGGVTANIAGAAASYFICRVIWG